MTDYITEEEKNALFEQLSALSGAFGVTGNEYGAAAVAERLLAPYTDEVRTDKRGNVVGIVRSGIEDAPVWVFDAHIDQVGVQVTGISDEGFLGFTDIGLDERLLPGQVFSIATRTGERIPAVVTLPRDPFALDVPSLHTLWLDTGMPAELVKERVHIGDFAAFAGALYEIAEGRVCGPALDDRSCFLSIACFARRLKESGARLPADIVFSGTVREEIGGPGAAAVAAGLNPSLFVALDVCHVEPGSKEDGKRLGGGPAIALGGDSDDVVSKAILETARAKDIPHGTYAITYASGTNAGTVRVTGEGIRCAVISVPLLYMHAPNEIMSLQDIAWAGELLLHFATRFKDDEGRRGYRAGDGEGGGK
ncbi:MAG: M20/M25/M40 family metallo-hydrolase [Clostridiales Family XIII bacterium]|jgi:endoglucanase|nr:M20/M25/M40 family metallo-hydrolase [Clostridiales Family XIII bacterium]